MNLLALDTSTSFASIALKVDDVFFEASETELTRHAEWLLPAMDRLLKQARISLKDLDGIVYGCGPGSFTGLRITCSTVKGLAMGADLPVYPVSTLQTIASSARAETVLAMVDARMQAWYWAVFEKGEQVTEERVSHPAFIELPACLRARLCGVGYETLFSELPQTVQKQITEKKTIPPYAKEMIFLVEQGKIAPVSAKEAPIHYIRQEVTHG